MEIIKIPLAKRKKAINRAHREIELENAVGFKSKEVAHTNKKKYKRQTKHKKGWQIHD
jgi:hypothetical protein